MSLSLCHLPRIMSPYTPLGNLGTATLRNAIYGNHFTYTSGLGTYKYLTWVDSYGSPCNLVSTPQATGSPQPLTAIIYYLGHSVFLTSQYDSNYSAWVSMIDTTQALYNGFGSSERFTIAMMWKKPSAIITSTQYFMDIGSHGSLPLGMVLSVPANVNTLNFYSVCTDSQSLTGTIPFDISNWTILVITFENETFTGSNAKWTFYNNLGQTTIINNNASYLGGNLRLTYLNFFHSAYYNSGIQQAFSAGDFYLWDKPVDNIGAGMTYVNEIGNYYATKFNLSWVNF